MTQPIDNLPRGLNNRNAKPLVEKNSCSSSSPRSQEPNPINIHMNGLHLFTRQSKLYKFSHITSPLVH